MLTVFGVNKFIRKTEKQKALLKQRAGDYVQKMTRHVLRDLVLNTPQWSGNTAASWTVVTNQSGAASPYSQLYDSDWEDIDPRWIGDKEAWRVAWAANEATVRSIKWNTKISVRNNAPFAEELATDPTIENYLRPGNYIPGDVMAINKVTAKYRVYSNIVGAQLNREFSR
jgi:hypothetical protein